MRRVNRQEATASRVLFPGLEGLALFPETFSEGEQRSLVQRELLPGSGAKRRPVAHSMGMLSENSR